MKNISIFCFGFGQVAKNFIKKINLEGYKYYPCQQHPEVQLVKKKFEKIDL